MRQINIPDGALQFKPIAKAVSDHEKLTAERNELFAERERLKREGAELLPADIPRVSEMNAQIMLSTARIEKLNEQIVGVEPQIRELVDKHRESWEAEQSERIDESGAAVRAACDALEQALEEHGKQRVTGRWLAVFPNSNVTGGSATMVRPHGPRNFAGNDPIGFLPLLEQVRQMTLPPEPKPPVRHNPPGMYQPELVGTG